ncbi:hypothetical protein HJC23_008761 [Cyclotella cryptica]|uniref:F-box domain-containing protein n=1 Tax=Cyclotella cryptica TaxID=29204 RepID=A0ABD3PCR1_9STRA|eukprot:CCRYP_015682-RA/>CCRYP_015682-RA protein AED:0.07 eAED:0.07 QI:0/-1/0/1/-1/1/1/0/1104
MMSKRPAASNDKIATAPPTTRVQTHSQPETMTGPHPTPQEFLTPAITEELDKSFAGIEEFFLDGRGDHSDESDGGHHQPSHPPAAAPAPTANYTRPLIESSAEAALAAIRAKTPSHSQTQHAASSATSQPKSSPVQTYPSWNAVHMELQNNAKLPTFNLSVNRSNSLSGLQIPAPRGRRSYGPNRTRRLANDSAVSSAASSVSGNEPVEHNATVTEDTPTEHCPSSPIPRLRNNTVIDPALKLDNETSEAIDEILRLNENDMNLSEIFFDEDRSSAALAYSCYGGSVIPRSFDIPKIESQSSLEGSTNEGASTSAAAAGEEALKMHGIAPRPGMPPKNAVYPYTRTKPLPIPVLRGPSPEKPAGGGVEAGAAKDNHGSNGVSNQTLAQAIATAAAIATTSPALSGVAQGGKLDESTAAALSVQPTPVSQVRPMACPPGSTIPALPPAASSQAVAPAPRMPVHPSSATSPPIASGSTMPGRPVHPSTQIPQASAPNPANIPGQPPPTKMDTPSQPQVTRPAPGTGPYNQGNAHRPVVHPPPNPHAVAHTTTKALAYASAQRSSYGYGVDHRVAGVPAPPPNPKRPPLQPMATVRNHPVTGNPYVPIYTTPAPAVKPATPAASTKPRAASEKERKTTAVDTEDPAYERKKQRAKDARVRLNEAIEELAVAIELAGSQSKERMNQFASSNDPSHDSTAASVNPLTKMMVETTTQAENAKKWDRPSFVGLSATIIHSLNAQCEGLMRELIQLKREREHWRNDGPGSVGEAGNVSLDASSAYFGSSLTGNNSDVSEPLSKRQKTGEDRASIISGKTIVCQDTSAEEQRRQIIQDVVDSPRLLCVIAEFLDPPSLCRCLCVSQQWISLNIFQNQETWLNLCYKRFGTLSVRKWEGDEDDEEETSATHVSPSMDLYCRMKEKNVKPYCSLDGSVFLGGSSLDGIVSGWVSLVERSNGETSRSVVLTQSVDGKAHSYYSPIPVVELRILVQNTGFSNGSIYIPDQQFSVDASTRRKGEKMLEVTGDERFKRRVIHKEKAGFQQEANIRQKKYSMGHEMCQLSMFEYAVLSVHIHARGCSTTSKFCHRAKKIQILVSINGTTRPLVVPISGQR